MTIDYPQDRATGYLSTTWRAGAIRITAAGDLEQEWTRRVFSSGAQYAAEEQSEWRPVPIESRVAEPPGIPREVVLGFVRAGAELMRAVAAGRCRDAGFVGAAAIVLETALPEDMLEDGRPISDVADELAREGRDR